MGEESLLIQCTEILLERGHDVRGIIANAPAITNWATEKGLAVFAPGKALAETLTKQPPFDYFLSITNLRIIPDAILALPKRGAINFHDGPLPKFAGLYATSWALLHQADQHGVTWHEMRSGIDKGDILVQQLFDIAKGETAFTLNVKAYEAAIATFAELVTGIETNSLQPRAQNLAEQTYFGKYDRPAAAATLDWNQPAEKLVALVNALQFGGYANPLALPKLNLNGRLLTLTAAKPGDPTNAAPGTIIAVDNESITVATANGSVVLSGLQTLDGTAVSHTQFTVNQQLPSLDATAIADLTALNDAIVRQEGYWLRRLAEMSAVELPYADHSSTTIGQNYATATMPLPAGVSGEPHALTAAFAAYLARLSGSNNFDIALSLPALADEVGDFASYFATQVPFLVKTDNSVTVADTLAALQAELESLQNKRKTFNRDIFLRQPELETLRSKMNGALLPILVQFANSATEFAPPAGTELALLLTPDQSSVTWVYDSAVYTPDIIAAMQTQFATFLQNAAQNGSHTLAETAFLSEAEIQKLLVDWNDTTVAYDTAVTIHQLIEAQADERPNAVAVVYEDQQLTYRQLNHRANQMARHLRHLGVGPETIVGVFMDRSIEMMVALIGIHKAGGAYLPLDPTYPKDRLAFMVEDTATPVLLTQKHLVASLPPHQAQVVRVDADWEQIGEQSGENVFSGVEPHNLAYVIYTSGSTGKPKGVMVQHGNAVNFFVGMDARIGDASIPHSPPGTWLAVTSTSFDISVLELFWTLARGFKVIIFDDKTRDDVTAVPEPPKNDKHVDFSLFYFSSDESEEGVTNKYRLLLEGARFGDKHGFSAVWMPERHFHAFGGLYPNPSVTGAAIAAITENVQIRSGSCVLPLHSPIRVAEEWSVVDNISNGRVGLSIAAGWQPNDFVLRPGVYADRKEIMFRDIEVVKELWRGGSITMKNDLGKDVEVKTLPHPVQKELPIWVTAAGNPETFREAGANGYNILTHLLGQSVDELSEKIRVYREAYEQAGHPGKGIVSLMLHTFIGDDVDEVREIVRGPMKHYLSSAMNLVRAAAWHFPTFKEKAAATGKSPFEVFDEEELTPEDVDALLNFAFERYFETSGLFGTPRSALHMVNRLKEIDVDDIACLIDYGVPSAVVLEHLHHLNELKNLAEPKLATEDFSIPAQIERHSVTHFQCTPSMASMLLMDERNVAALGTVQTMMVGGEALPAALAQQLKQIVPGRVINMYGPTETTIWSTTHEVTGEETAVPIGTPIANTQIYILDAQMQPAPVGVAGDLYIGGDGVVRGYHNRPELTAERFVQDPFRSDADARMYATGDLARYRADGNIDFLGRADFQVKLRGYRIELGEIEALLNAQNGVREAVVTAREDTPGDKRLVAYVIMQPGQKLDGAALKEALRADLPEFMVPATYVPMTSFPLTPNKKTDRKALPAPDKVLVESQIAYVAPTNDLEQQIAEIWQRLLNVPQVGLNDNFFDLGGHSLLTVQAHRQLKEVVDKPISITDMFRFPTIRALADYLSEENGANGTQTAVEQSVDRAANRREAMMQRRNLRQRVR
ncbi:MAG: LLM class flavin-dependent oxidoreductase [Ardenticatenaceae bacterium]|nr:LLM class flavin-dependent oxidoreductase [Anaerolineales bacterium]MCB8941852.1 LLM class flavin-dependent oxidoreductase [Ardenticatenaceae bacterium]MCB8972966.1 LLM class flavin-dependent oxidoreductase [Ardenticatenaceae bacterium]